MLCPHNIIATWRCSDRDERDDAGMVGLRQRVEAEERRQFLRYLLSSSNDEDDDDDDNEARMRMPPWVTVNPQMEVSWDDGARTSPREEAPGDSGARSPQESSREEASSRERTVAYDN
ncbi:PREDICTED: uncharacterized protein LOC105462527 isoform X2 [Wasmannia auropunctata]|uniref:uncharacterized protein LOC105462527 isoform X2 n=1 Tax=Wasmannia auropunctata TaxID=64793 RepID=UPI0005ED4F62|nr:PREDICTED: uncharacterized protein LOC105462527 isoform X2 [Wasmannia auropunctata]XP_011707482.1 PREDICTED: uncharacterized protein LOC105462527 isoform X2 [Wasmannia auropunctata]